MTPEDPSLPTTHDLSVGAREARGRVWIDGCFDFVHHGHAGAMLQARQLGTALLVGVHSDEAITVNKGPPVMEMGERIAAVDANRWATRSVPDAPYVTALDFIDQYGTRYVVHGDDITSDADGNDCYRFVKEAGRFLVVKRTPGISTTDLVARMLAGPGALNAHQSGPIQAASTDAAAPKHHVRSLPDVLAGKEACASGGPELQERIANYATDATGLAPGVPVWDWSGGESTSTKSAWTTLVPGPLPQPDQRVVYVDGSWDLFCSGHIAFLQAVAAEEDSRAQEAGWFEDERRAERVQRTGADYAPAYVVAGVQTDAAVNKAKGANYPIMSIFERGLCVLQCKYVSAVLFSAPRTNSKAFLTSFAPALGTQHPHPDAVYHGPTATAGAVPRAYRDAAELGIFTTIDQHPWQDVHAETIVARILNSRARYEERQRIKGVKGVGEEEIRGRGTG